MTTEQLVEIVRLSVKEGDVLFVDAEAVDIDALKQYKFPSLKFSIVPMLVPPGKTVADCLVVASRDFNPEDHQGSRTM